MRSIAQERRRGRNLRHKRIRRRVSGSSGQPRLAVFRSLRHIYAQIIDDESGRTLCAISSLEGGGVQEALTAEKARLKRSRMLGKLLAQRAKEKGIVRVAFDRGGYLYHGHIKELAEGAREGGLEF
jgi:large subunit ribosomal protein L18